jgi:uncharacterized protein YbjT (DUF2867 family)
MEVQTREAELEKNMPSEDEAKKRVLVIGGTGLVGTPVVKELDARGWDVRVMARDGSGSDVGPGVELVTGDARSAQDLSRAMARCQAVLISVSDILNPYLDFDVTCTVVKVARQSSPERIGLISGASVHEDRRWFPLIEAKVRAEQILKVSGVPWVIVRLTWPMESLARFVRGKRASILGRQPAVIHPVAGVDIGRMVANALELDEALGHTFTIHGPEGYTMNQWLTEYCELTGSPARVRNIPFWMLSLVAMLTRNRELEAAIELMKYFDGLPEYGDPTEANRILGAPTVTLEEWVASRQAVERTEAGRHERLRPVAL